MMARIRQKSEKKGIVMTLLTLLLIGTACNDQTDNPTINPSVGEMVEVSLNIGFAHETDASTLLAANTTKSTASPSGNEPLSVQLVPATRSAEATTAHPDQFYNLEIYQYDANGTYLANTTAVTVAEGPITATLNNSTAQLLIIARGSTPAISSFANKPLSDVRKLTASADIIKAIGVEDGTNINNMPYLLYLPKVKIENSTLVSPEGVDVRLLLKRLAVGLKLDWTISQNMLDQGYVLKEARLMQVPADYRILPERETEAPYGEMYPTGISEFIDGFRLKGEALNNAYGSATLWLPANARGTRRDINVPNQKSKRRAHSSATYIEFVVDNSANQERLFYRVYLGANMTTDFNLLENTNYHWTIKIETPSYTTDERVQLLDQTPVISANEQPTANCFMMRPGTNICFNPYKHEAGTNGWNTYLIDSETIAEDKTIASVKILWQTKDVGTSGDLVMGYVIDNDKLDHKNLVNLTDGSDKDKARIHVKVPVTNGGNALIAACNSSGIIVWSWHLWITDYVPQGITSTINYEQAQAMTKGGSVHQYATDVFKAGGIYANKVMMDRNLCATAGGFPGSDASNIEFAKRYGYQYQWGRKDPFFGSTDGTTNEIKVIYNGDGEATAIQKAAYGSSMLQNGNTLSWSIQHPLSFITGNDSWYDGNLSGGGHKNLFDNAGKKTLYDPCPNGWTLAFKSSVEGINRSTAYWFDTDNTFKETGKANSKVGGRLCNLTGETGLPVSRTIHNTAWYPVTPFRSKSSGALSAPTNGYYSFREVASSGNYINRYYYIRITENEWTLDSSSGIISDAEVFRCIQK